MKLNITQEEILETLEGLTADQKIARLCVRLSSAWDELADLQDELRLFYSANDKYVKELHSLQDTIDQLEATQSKEIG